MRGVVHELSDYASDIGENEACNNGYCDGIENFGFELNRVESSARSVIQNIVDGHDTREWIEDVGLIGLERQTF